MIISASYKTDIPAFYGPWFLNRVAAGRCVVANPYGGRPSTVALTPEAVDGFVFWTRNVEPFLPALATLQARFPFVVHYTVTGYPRPLETSVIAADRSVALIRALSAAYGRRAVVWRYDPVVATSLTPPDWHAQTFAGLCRALAGVVDEVVVSFAHIYRKTGRNLSEAARDHGFAWQDPGETDKRALLARLAAIAADHGLTATLCGQAGLRVPGVADARCIDAGRLADVAGRPVAARSRPHRPCGCAESRDIGAYDTCPHGCVYCYAVGHRDRAKAARAAHDPEAESLSPGAAPGGRMHPAA